jgi:hypothetical protein
MRSAIVKSAMVGAALLVASGTARASDVVEFNVPFAFHVNNETFPAGRYMVQKNDMAGSSVLLIRGMHTPQSTFVMTHAADGHGPGEPTLQFEHRENQYRLSTIWESQSDGQTIIARR